MPWKQVTIEHSFEPDSLVALLQEGARGSVSRYTHFDIVDWASRYAAELKRHQPLEGDTLKLWRVADDITVRWELHMAGTYSINEMKRFSQVDILLPKQYFETWLNELDSL
ncbi:MAG: hypothetical protein LAT62_07950 [Natronospirillum sp.]|uniref:hypothetical protein n=1 Tax=Natronospirillum sp. TaxID=2812955 RepID=UPI0025EAA3F0|nr:hypothetical protein [Natronospirillum sp.]MCH8551853.1 hypothetical protein [Natronospirillum sp.]